MAVSIYILKDFTIFLVEIIKIQPSYRNFLPRIYRMVLNIEFRKLLKFRKLIISSFWVTHTSFFISKIQLFTWQWTFSLDFQKMVERWWQNVYDIQYIGYFKLDIWSFFESVFDVFDLNLTCFNFNCYNPISIRIIWNFNYGIYVA